MSFASARKNTSYGGREVPASHVSIPRSLPRDRTAQRHTVSPTKIVPPLVSNSENRVSYSADEKGKMDHIATDKSSSLNDADDGLCRKNVTVTVCLESLLPGTDKQLAKSDNEDSLTEVCANQQPDGNVAETATKSDVDLVLHEFSSPASTAVSSEFCDDNEKDAGHVEPAYEECGVVSEDVVIGDAEEPAVCVPVVQPEVLDSVLDEQQNLLPAVGENADETAVLAVKCEDVVVTEARLPPVTEHSVIDTAVKLCSVSEEVAVVSDVAGESNCHDLMQAAVLSYIPEELTVCAAAVADDKQCLADGEEELLISRPTEQTSEALSSCLPSNVTVGSDDNNAPVMSPAVDGDEPLQSMNGGSLEALDSSQSVVGGVCLPESLSFSNTQSSCGSLTETCTTDTQQLPAEIYLGGSSSAAETDVQDEDIVATTSDHHVGFTIGESSITDGIFRRCSMDLSGRGVVLSRIVEESAAGLAAVAGDGTQSHLHDGEQHVTAGKPSIL